ncbi:MAG: hypothetical protein HUU47_11315, partial [Bacteroidetes bacterium]|nr:hypothetical protein [Bacteroidota bacterium]
MFSQVEANNWYFRDSVGISFIRGEPEIINFKKFAAGGLPASYSNKKGRLIFYGGLNKKSNKNEFYDSTGNLMLNSEFTNGNGSVEDSSQGFKLVIPHPDTSDLYYIFTSFGSELYYSNNISFNFSLLDMRLNNGNGGFNKENTVKKIIIKENPGIATIHLTTALHKNQKDIWLISLVHFADSTFFCCYKISKNGINTSPVKDFISKNNYFYHFFRISPDNKKIVFSDSVNNFSIADFDNETGKIRNIIRIPCKLTKGNMLNFEFSNNSKFLYIIQNPLKIIQYDISLSSALKIKNSVKTIDSSYKKSIFYPQLAPDGRIYIISALDSFIHVIHAPDSIGKYARSEKKYIKFKNKWQSGFPIFPSYLFEKKTILISKPCINDTTHFIITDTN